MLTCPDLGDFVLNLASTFDFVLTWPALVILCSTWSALLTVCSTWPVRMGARVLPFVPNPRQDLVPVCKKKLRKQREKVIKQMENKLLHLTQMDFPLYKYVLLQSNMKRLQFEVQKDELAKDLKGYKKDLKQSRKSLKKKRKRLSSESSSTCDLPVEDTQETWKCSSSSSIQPENPSLQAENPFLHPDLPALQADLPSLQAGLPSLQPSLPSLEDDLPSLQAGLPYSDDFLSLLPLITPLNDDDDDYFPFLTTASLTCGPELPSSETEASTSVNSSAAGSHVTPSFSEVW